MFQEKFVVNKKLQIPFNAPLNKEDTEKQTYGCRYKNPDACKNCYTKNCAFSREDCICKSPSTAWKRQYNKLKEEENK